VRRLALLAGSALLLAGCGGPSADSVLSDTAANLGKIRSGTLHASVLVTPRGGAGTNPFGFKLEGPFALGAAGSLPVLRVAYTQIANGKSATVTILSTGRKAYVQTGGKTYELPESQAEQLRSAAGEVRSAGSLSQFAIDSWIDDPHTSDGSEVGGAETDKVTADLDVVAVVTDLLRLARAFGRDVPQLGEADTKRLADSVRDSSFVLYTGKDDRLLRRLELAADLGLDVPPDLRRALGELVGAKVDFTLGVDDPNHPVTVPEPEGALPPSALSPG
jgi:hypothetical protein